MQMIILACALCFWGAAGIAQATLLGSYVWKSEDPGFGGLSGIEVLDGGARLVAIGDRGISIQATVTRLNGVISDIQYPTIFRTRGPSGDPLGPGETDSEGLALGPDGDFYMSFEGKDVRIIRYNKLDQAGVLLPLPRGFRSLQGNAGLEALAVDADGTLFAIPERSGRATRPFPVYRYKNDTWDIPLSIPRIGAFLIVGADFGPDGQLYVLERDFTGFGFRSRVRRFNLASQTEETILQTGIIGHGNLEGISLWVNASGETIITMIADDNFSSLQQTEVVEYRVDG